MQTHVHTARFKAMEKPTIRMLRLPEVEAKTGLSRETIFRGGREGWFPKSVKISPASNGWVEGEIDTYLEARIAERDASLSTPQNGTIR
jgi:prophage regulatory protein